MGEVYYRKYDKHGAYHWTRYVCGKMREMTDEIVAYINAKKHESIIDIGCGDGLYTCMLGAYGIDSNEKAIEIARLHSVSCDCVSVYRIRHLQRTWDAACLFDVFEHFSNQEKALRFIRTVTDTLYILNPDPTGSPYHTTEFTGDGIVEFLANRGWETVYRKAWEFTSTNKKTFLECRRK